MENFENELKELLRKYNYENSTLILGNYLTILESEIPELNSFIIIGDENKFYTSEKRKLYDEREIIFK